MSREEEASLIREICAGDTAAFERLVQEHQRQVYTLALRMTGNEEDAFDLAQDVFLKVYQSLPSFRGDCSLGSWLYRMTANMSIDLLRKKKRRKVDQSISLDAEREDERSLELPDYQWEPQSHLEKKELHRMVRVGLSKLPEEQRLILIMRDVNGLSYQEISEALELEQGTVKSRIYRARAHLAKLLLSDGNFFSANTSKRRKGR